MLAVVIAPDGSRMARVEVVSDYPRGGRGAGDEGAHRRGRRGDPRGAGRRPVKPLAGRTVLVTRPADQSVELVRRLRRLGATAIVAPADRDRAGAIRRTDARRCATWRPAGSRGSRSRAARRWRCWRRGWTSPSDVRANVAAIGEGTGTAFRALGAADARPHARDVHHRRAGARLPARRRARALRARRHRARRSRGRARREGLVARSASTPTGRAWRASLPAEARAALRDGGVDAVTFTSASTVRGFVGAMGVVRGEPEGRVHRSGHGPRGAGARPARLGRRPPAHDRGPGRGAGTGPRRVLGRIPRMSFPQQRPRRMRRTPALRALIRETDAGSPAADRAAVREGGHRRAAADRVDAGAVPAHARDRSARRRPTSRHAA